MKTRFVLMTTWLTSDSNRTRALGLSILLALALAAGFLPQEVALAGSATGGSH